MNRSSLVVALIVVAIVGAGIAVAQLALQNDAVKFPDGTLQKSAAETPGIFVQKSVIFGFADSSFCGTGVLYTVPAGKRLRIEWMSAAIAFAPDGGDPVDINVKTWLNNLQVSHWLVRLDNAINFGPSFFYTQRWSSPVTIQSQASKTVEIDACGASDTVDMNVLVTFHGQLFNQ